MLIFLTENCVKAMINRHWLGQRYRHSSNQRQIAKFLVDTSCCRAPIAMMKRNPHALLTFCESGVTAKEYLYLKYDFSDALV